MYAETADAEALARIEDDVERAARHLPNQYTATLHTKIATAETIIAALSN